jgi:hypothetical protein
MTRGGTSLFQGRNGTEQEQHMADATDVALPGTGDFVGREAELAALLQGLDRARARRGGLYLIGGEPGIGKSRLADEFVARARSAGALVLWGRGWEGAGAPAYWPWIQALRVVLRTFEPRELAELMATGAADVAQMLPELRPVADELPSTAPDSESARFQLFDSTTSLLRNVGRRQVSVLVLDDLHAADVPSILLLRFLASQLGDMQLLAVATYRDMALTRDHPLTSALGELAREPTTHMLSLGGLREDAVRPLIESATGVAPAARLVRELWRETGGNPLFLGEAARLLVSEKRLEEGAVLGPLRLAVPAGVREVIARRVRQLPTPTVEALTFGAALGPEFATETLRRVGDYTAEAAVERLGEADDAGLVAPVTGSLGRYRFSHDLVRESIYQEQSPAERARLHRRIADKLEELYAPSPESHLGELAHHYFEAAQGGADRDSGDPARKAQTYASGAAAVAVRSLAYEEAARLYRMALAMLDAQPLADDETRTELLLSIGDAEARAGEMDASNAAFLQAAELARQTGVAAHLARAALGIGGRLPWARPGHNRHLIPMLQEALVLLGGGDEFLRVRLLARLSTAWRSSPEQRSLSATLSQQALESARRLGDPATLSYALAARYWATWWPENPEERLVLAREMIDVAKGAGDAERLIDAHLMLWLSYTEVGQIAEAKRELDELRQLGDQLREPAHRWLGVAPHAGMALMEGRFSLAGDLIERESEPGPPTTLARDNVSSARFHTFLLAREQGRIEVAEADVRAAVDEFPWFPLHRAALCLLLIERGRHAEARAVFDGLAQDEFSAFYRDNEWLLGISLASEACALLDDASAAATLYAQMAPFAGRHAIGHAEGSIGAVDRYLGLLAATTRRLDDAVKHLEEAVHQNQQMGLHPWAAHAQSDLADVLRLRDAVGDRQRAAELQAAAGATAGELGMTALAGRLAKTPKVAAEPTQGMAADVPATAIARREGELWMIAFGGQTFRLRDAKGLHYLARLLAEPGREFLALDLAHGAGMAAPATAATSPELRAADLGDAGVQLDEQAKQAYRQRLRDLQTELDEAEGWNDAERADQARQEMEFLARELARAIGLGGRDRTAASASERARLSVTRAIRLAMARIAQNSAALGDHLEATVHTGTYCVYRPDPRVTVDWQV